MKAPLSTLRLFLALLALGLWLGALLFFAAGVAPNAFAVLGPVTGGGALAGDIVGRALMTLHVLGLAFALAFLLATGGRRSPAHWLVWGMVALTIIAQIVGAEIHTLRASGLTATSQFRFLHGTSTLLEVGVFILGLIAFWKTVPRAT